ncbi:MAG TPA: FG-GAP-like repeat-containing protein [Pyrinomonadaceae bacterium]|nr:FG-GAP-like repeat-containing protein [Pyrinomonadaceae bacterium]
MISNAAPGDLDTTFGTGGKTITPVGTGNDEANDLAVQADGKIIVAGHTQNGSTTDISLVRYNSNGTLDNSFGVGGKVVIPIAGYQEGYAVAIQGDGKIVVVGRGDDGATAFGSGQITRFNSDGTLDTSFGGGAGFVTNSFNSNTIVRFNDVAIQADGKIVIAGYLVNGIQRLLTARFNADGTLDNFAVAGSASGPVSYYGNAVAIQSNGQIVVGGKLIAGGASGVWIRYNSDLTPDGSSPEISSPIQIEKIAIQPDGKIVFGGVFSVARFNANKTLDTSFGNNGWNAAVFGTNVTGSSGKGLILQTDGKIVLGGGITQTNKKFALARFNSNGFLDVGFGDSGKVITPIVSGDNVIYNLEKTAEGNILAVGSASNGTDNDLAIAKYLGENTSTLANNTAFDFDGDGKADSAVFRGGNWYILQSLNNSLRSAAFGQTGDVIVPADYDGDGRTDTAVFRPANATWYILRSSDGGFSAQQFGTSDSLPRPGDFDGDGKADIAVFYPVNGYWYIKQSQFGATRIVNFGTNGDVPLIANFDGDNKDDIAVFRGATGTWYWLKSSDNSFNAAQFGANGDLPAIGDYDGDGKSDLSVYRPSSGTWYQQRSTSGFSAVSFGISSDRPVAADYDGDGKTDVAVFRNGNWYELQSSNNGFAAVSWGQSGDIAVPSAFVP